MIWDESNLVFGREQDFPLLAKCFDERIFGFKRGDNEVVIVELCDDYFGFAVSPEEIAALGDELKRLADSIRAAPPI